MKEIYLIIISSHTDFASINKICYSIYDNGEIGKIEMGKMIDTFSFNEDITEEEKFLFAVEKAKEMGYKYIQIAFDEKQFWYQHFNHRKVFISQGEEGWIKEQAELALCRF